MEVPTKKFYNNVDSCIEESLSGFVRTYPQLQLHTFQRIIINSKLSESDTVGLISGGGSGHEPFSSGYVGTGMLSASVSGDIFASPPPANILKAIREVAKFKKKGILLIILNYTGDCLNFGIASYRATCEKIKVETFICEDDCAHMNEDVVEKKAQIELMETTITGRRGVAGAIFIFKIAGALAQEGKSIKEIIDNLNQISKNIATLGVCFDACSLPGQAKMFHLHSEEIEIGIGVHGEAGAARTKYGSVQTIIHGILNKISKILNLQRGDVIALIINNLGGTSKLEENIVVSEVVLQFEKNNITVARVYSGHLMTALEMAGIQVSVLRLEESNRALWLQCLDTPTEAPAWPGKSYSVPSGVTNFIKILSAVSTVKGKTIIQLTEYGDEMLKECLSAAANALIAKEKHLNSLDRICGDGDCGSTLRRLAEGRRFLIACL